MEPNQLYIWRTSSTGVSWTRIIIHLMHFTLPVNTFFSTYQWHGSPNCKDRAGRVEFHLNSTICPRAGLDSLIREVNVGTEAYT